MTLTTILAIYGIVVLATIFLQVLAAAQKLDFSQIMGNRESLPSLTGLAGRLDRAQMNSVIALALVAPAILILTQMPEVPGSAPFAATLFLIARIAYVVVYAMGIAYLRTIVWLVGFVMTFWLYLLAL